MLGLLEGDLVSLRNRAVESGLADVEGAEHCVRLSDYLLVAIDFLVADRTLGLPLKDEVEDSCHYLAPWCRYPELDQRRMRLVITLFSLATLASIMLS